MSTSTSRVSPPSRKEEPAPAHADAQQTRSWSDRELHRVLAWSGIGVLVFGAGWLGTHANWLLWPAGLCALALQLTATMVAARSAVDRRDDGTTAPRPAKRRARGSAAAHTPRSVRREPSPPADDGLLVALLRLLLGMDAADGNADASEASEPEPAAPAPLSAVVLHDRSLHRAFFRRVIEAEFAEHPAGLVWPDLSALQGSLTTRLRLYQRHPQHAPVPIADIAEIDRSAQSPWHHLTALEPIDYRRGDAVARFSHRAFAPLAFLELHARLDLDSGEREALEAELSRQYTVGYGRILTPPAVLSAMEPLRLRMGSLEAIGVADEARLAMRGSSSVREAERIRAEWQARARARREQAAWPGDVISAVECLIDYWFVQRAAAADMEWAEGQARMENSSLGAALAARDASGTLHFAEALALVCGAPARAADAADAERAQPERPTAAETVA